MTKLPPSSAARRVACPGSRALEEKYKSNERSDSQREGECAHFVATEFLRGALSVMYGSDEFTKTCTDNKSGYSATEEMLEGAKMYAEHVVSFASKTFQFHLEEKLDISVIYPECIGTPDCWAYSAEKKELHIWEYKFGHRVVDVYENFQMMEYAAGILELLKITGIEDRTLKVHFHIVQPRSFHRDGRIRTWPTTAVNLRPYFNLLQQAEHLAAEDTALCSVSPECLQCTARHACPALQQTALEVVEMAVLNTPFDLTPAQTGHELRLLKRAAKLLEARITGLEGQATAMLTRGDSVPHFALQQGYGRDRWTKDVEEIVVLGDLFGVNLAKPIDVITPNKAVALGVPKEMVAEYSEKPKGALKLVEDDGKKARKIFGDKK